MTPTSFSTFTRQEIEFFIGAFKQKHLCQKCYQTQKRALNSNRRSSEPNPKRARFL